MAAAEIAHDNATAQDAEQQLQKMKDNSVKLIHLFEHERKHFDMRTHLREVVFVAVLLAMFVFAGGFRWPVATVANGSNDWQVSRDPPAWKVCMWVAEIAITSVVLVLVLPMVKDAMLAEDTKLLLVAEHGRDDDDSATDPDKIEYQLERRLTSGARYWRTGSMETDFKFYCATRHPVLQFFASGKPYGPGKFVRAVLECNAILMAVSLETQTEMVQNLTMGLSGVQWVLSALVWKLFIVIFPMFWSWVQWETLVCPCQSSSARTGHFSSCALCCKFRMSSAMRVYWVLTAVLCTAHAIVAVPWNAKLAALAARSLGYLLFFVQNYVTWKTWRCCPLPFFGKWDKEKAQAEALLTGQVNSPKFRGESCRMATIKLCPIITCAFGPVILVVAVVGPLFEPENTGAHHPGAGAWALVSLGVVAALALCWRSCIRTAQRSESNAAAEEHLLAGEMFSSASTP